MLIRCRAVTLSDVIEPDHVPVPSMKDGSRSVEYPIPPRMPTAFTPSHHNGDWSLSSRPRHKQGRRREIRLRSSELSRISRARTLHETKATTLAPALQGSSLPRPKKAQFGHHCRGRRLNLHHLRRDQTHDPWNGRPCAPDRQARRFRSHLPAQRSA